MGPAKLTGVTRAEVEEFLFREAELLDGWKLDAWAELLAEDASYYVPPTDKPEASHDDTLFIIADDIVRLRERLIRLKDPACHVEYPPSRTRRAGAEASAATVTSPNGISSSMEQSFSAPASCAAVSSRKCGGCGWGWWCVVVA